MNESRQNKIDKVYYQWMTGSLAREAAFTRLVALLGEEKARELFESWKAFLSIPVAREQ